MTRGKRPAVAIGEAKRSAVAAGFVVVDLVTEAKLAFDFVVLQDRLISLVRVRRLKQAGFRVANIMRACAQPIAELQSCTLPDQLVRELWVRGPARAYHRYRVLPDTVEEIGVVVMQRAPEKTAGEEIPQTESPEKGKQDGPGDLILLQGQRPASTGLSPVPELPVPSEFTTGRLPPGNPE